MPKPNQPAAKSGEKQVSEAAFLKSMDKHKQAAQASAKKDRPQGSLEGEALAQLLGLEVGQRYLFSARVATIGFGFAKDDANRPYLRFAYSLTSNGPSGKGVGQIVSNYYELTEGKKTDGEVFRTVEEAYDQVYFEIQGLGEDTSAYTNVNADLIKAAKKHTAEKTEVQIAISCTKAKTGDKIYVNYRVMGPADNSDLDTGESTDTDNSEQFNPDDWVGLWVSWTDADGTVEFKVTSHDADGFYGEDDETQYGPAPFAEVTYMDPQPE